jgi:hypothetical protein
VEFGCVFTKYTHLFCHGREKHGNQGRKIYALGPVWTTPGLFLPLILTLTLATRSFACLGCYPISTLHLLAFSSLCLVSHSISRSCLHLCPQALRLLMPLPLRAHYSLLLLQLSMLSIAITFEHIWPIWASLSYTTICKKIVRLHLPSESPLAFALALPLDSDLAFPLTRIACSCSCLSSRPWFRFRNSPSCYPFLLIETE